MILLLSLPSQDIILGQGMQLYIHVAFKAAWYNNFVATPSIFESLTLKQTDLYGKTIITHVLHID